MQVDVWSDVVCPWCYIGKRRLESALARFPERDAVKLVWHSFELDANSPKESKLPMADLLAQKYGMSREKAKAMQAQVTGVAAQDGLTFRLDDALPTNTFDAHRLLHLAKARGLQDTLKERLFLAYFTEGKPVGDATVLADLAAEAGLDRAEAAAVLADATAYAKEVRADEAHARQIGVRGVPFFVIDQKYGVSGAQPAEAILGALTQAWGERAPVTAAGEVCDEDGCAVPAKA